jgi:DNA invertase Pin-like site-specific DNA recombinase
VYLLVRYSNHEDALKHVVKLLRRIEDYDQRDEPGVQLPEPPPLRGLARLIPNDVRQLVESFRAGTPKHALAHRYEISLSTVKRLLRSVEPDYSAS